MKRAAGADDPAGPALPYPPSLPVLLLHGQPGGARDWERVVPLLTDLSTIAPDRPGYDGSPARGFFGNALAAVELLDELGIGRAVVAGYSWGAGVALAAAMIAPDRVAAVTLVAPLEVQPVATRTDRLMAWRPAHEAFAAAMRVGGTRLARPMALLNGSRLDRTGLELLREGLGVSRRGPIWATFYAEQRFLVAELATLDERLHEVRMPAVVVVPARDKLVAPRNALWLAERLPQGRVHPVQAGHLVPLEAPEAVAAAIRITVGLAGRSAPDGGGTAGGGMRGETTAGEDG